VVLDIDASLHEIRSQNKVGTAPHCKGGFGFHPIGCFADATGEYLSSTQIELAEPETARPLGGLSCRPYASMCI
jgi:hypothetical protein